MRHRLLYTIGYHLIRVYARIVLKLDMVGHEQLPPGPKLFVANHPSATDPFLIHLVSTQPMSVLISVNAFTVPILGDFLSKIEQIPVVPEQGGQALEHAERTIKKGRSVTIFPEGDFSPQEGGFREPRTGAARLALSTGVPVIPVGIHIKREWSYRIVSGVSGKQTVGYWYLHGPYTVTVGEPLYFDGTVDDRQRVTDVSNSIMSQIHQLAAESEARWSKSGRTGLVNDGILWMRALVRRLRAVLAW
jgi:1-acyl-sn-glycerol-3-phosphate acyltransferase